MCGMCGCFVAGSNDGAIIIDPLITTNDITAQHVILRSDKYPSMTDLATPCSCLLSFPVGTKVDIDIYDLSYAGDSIEAPYYLELPDKSVCAEQGGSFNSNNYNMYFTGETWFKLTTTEKFDGRFWISLKGML